MAEPLRLFVCGLFAVHPNGGGSPIRRLRTRKTEQLCAYLALDRDHWRRRDALAELFWPDDEPAAGRRKLRLALHSIRQVFGSCLESTGDKVCLSGLWVDALDEDPSVLRDFELLLGEHDGILAGHQTRLETIWQEKLRQLAASATENQEKAALSFKLGQLSPRSIEAVADLQRAVKESENKAALKAMQVGGGAAHQSLLSSLALCLLGGDEPVSALLVGPPGVGKTYLARQLLSLAGEEEIVPLFVSMLGVTSLVEMEEKVSKALLFSGGVVGKLEVLNLTSTLLVIDNADDLAVEAGEFFARLTPPGSPLRILVTLPEARFEGFRVFRHKPLSLPKEATPEALSDSEAGQFLAAKAGISLAQANPKVCARLCAASGGLPLVLQHSAKDFAFLSSLESENDETRHSSASKAISARLNQGFERLDEELKTALLTLSLLGPQFHPRLAEALGTDLDCAAELWERSWIQHSSDGRTYEFLPSIYAFLLKRARPGIKLPADYGQRMAELVDDLVKGNYLLVSEVFLPTLALMKRALNEAVENDSNLITSLWSGVYFCLLRQNDLAEAVKVAASIYGDQPGRRWQDGRGLNFYGSAAFFEQEFALAERIFRHMMLSDNSAVSDLGVCNAGLVAQAEQRWDDAVLLMKLALEHEGLKPRQLTARWNNLAHALAGAGNYKAAEESALKALSASQEVEGAEEFRALASAALAAVYFLTERQEEARAWGARAAAAWGDDGHLPRRLEAVQLRMLIESKSDPGSVIHVLRASFPRYLKGPIAAASQWAPAAACLLEITGMRSESRMVLSGLAWPSNLFWLSKLMGPEPAGWRSESVQPFSDRERWFIFLDALKRL